ncbi:MAG TPA: MFS transporter [Kribbella sp.]|uniref:MFS transporter n=1 Tax=Kribbella sp. TaxID=1871183 RepID=UPI002D768B5C|nr:MFS transporter [Kribbella sp.]HET6298490.1 MFS transporter [Kribbella sp.]
MSTQQQSRRQHSRNGPLLAGRYSAAVAQVLVALSPFIVLSTASLFITQQVSDDLHASVFGVQLADGLSNAGYAFGAVAAADLIRRLPMWRLYILTEAAFAVGSLLAALAPNIGMFTVGRVVQGLATGLLLVIALPPLVTRHGAARVPLSAAFVSLGLFGMVTLGPVIGGVVAGSDAWRLLFLIAAVLGVAGALLGLLAFERQMTAPPRLSFDWSGIPLALVATVLPFFGVSWLVRGGFGSPVFYLPVVVGLVALLVLLVRQYRQPRPLMPLKLISHTLPVTGIATAMVTGASVTALVDLAVVYMLQVEHRSPAMTGLILATQVFGVVVAAILFKSVLRTRWLPVLALGGLGVTALGGVLLLGLGSGGSLPLLLVSGLLLGFGAGAGVSPGLFMAGLSVPSNRLGPTFALVELLRSEAAFLVAPAVAQFVTLYTDPAVGVQVAVLILVVICMVSGALILGLLLLGGARPHVPDLDAWIAGEHPAYRSPRLANAIRHPAVQETPSRP